MFWSHKPLLKLDTKVRFGHNRPETMPTKLSNDVIIAAIEGFEAQKKRIDAQIAELRQLKAGGSSEPIPTTKPARKQRKMSAAGRNVY
jgi:hypothetical protein